MSIKVIVATHKHYSMPTDPVYLPLHVGRQGAADLGYAGDDTDDNISAKNANYCELTGLYWAWKNLEADAIGLIHYRWHFMYGNKIISGAEIEKLLKDYNMIVPKKRHYRRQNWPCKILAFLKRKWAAK